MISGNPASLQLRYLQTLTEIGATQNSTVVFPLPLDVVKPFLEAMSATAGDGEAALKDGSAHAELSEGERPVAPPSPRVKVGRSRR